MQVIEHQFFGVQLSLGRVQILGLVVANGAATERDQLAALVVDGEHQAVTEIVVVAPALALADEPAFFDLLHREASRLQLF